jgi:hypothetical protein
MSATKIENIMRAEAWHEMVGEGNILAALRGKAEGHLPLSVTSFISPHPESPFPSFDTGGDGDTYLPL